MLLPRRSIAFASDRGLCCGCAPSRVVSGPRATARCCATRPSAPPFTKCAAWQTWNARLAGSLPEDDAGQRAVQAPRIACTGLILAARTAGQNPPRMPIAAAATIAETMIPTLGSNLKTISENVAQFMVENDLSDIRSDAAAPRAPPPIDRTTDSN